jgi:glutaredoxin
MSEIRLYMMEGCYKCQRVKEHLASQQIDFQEINILYRPESIQELKELTGEVITPVVSYKQEVIIGDQLEEIDRLLANSSIVREMGKERINGWGKQCDEEV